jgi:hypothetical protein
MESGLIPRPQDLSSVRLTYVDGQLTPSAAYDEAEWNKIEL